MVFFETSDSLKPVDLENVENEFGIIFPADFKKHYLKYNGGYPEKDEFTWEDKSTTTINTFFSIKYKGFSNLEAVYRQVTIDDPYLPVGIFPFAVDDGGNFFCISVRLNDYDCIYYCNDDHYESMEEEGYLELLTTGFGKFLDNLSMSD